MNAAALTACRTLFPGTWMGLDFPAGLYAVAGVESGLDLSTGGVAESNGSTSWGPWQVNDRAWPYLGAPPLGGDWNGWAAWMSSVVSSTAWGFAQLAQELTAKGIFDASKVWLWLPYYWRHGRSATLDRMRATRSGDASVWSNLPLDQSRLQTYARYYSEAQGFQGPSDLPSFGGTFSKLANDAGGAVALGFIFFMLAESG